MAMLVEPVTVVDECCTYCCNCADLGTHDYCLPCETNPDCPRFIREEPKEQETKKKSMSKGNGTGGSS